MLKALLQIILTIIAGYAAQLYLPFWSMALAAFFVAVFFRYKLGLASFFAGFLAAFFLWCAYAYTLDSENGAILSSKLEELFKLNRTYLPYVSGLIGGLLGGFGALTGTTLRRLFG